MSHKMLRPFIVNVSVLGVHFPLCTVYGIFILHIGIVIHIGHTNMPFLHVL